MMRDDRRARDVARLAVMRRGAPRAGRLSTPWLTLREAERYARVQHGTILEAARRGEIACYRRTEGTAVLVHAASVDAWIREHWTAIGGKVTDIDWDGRDDGSAAVTEFDGRGDERAAGAEYDGGGAIKSEEYDGTGASETRLPCAEYAGDGDVRP